MSESVAEQDGRGQWVKVDPDGLAGDQVTTVVAGGRAICLTRTAEGYGALDNRCPHQGGPLGGCRKSRQG